MNMKTDEEAMDGLSRALRSLAEMYEAQALEEEREDG